MVLVSSIYYILRLNFYVKIVEFCGVLCQKLWNFVESYVKLEPYTLYF